MHVGRLGCGLFFMLWWVSISLAAAATSAGSEILNTAVLVYIDSSSGETVEVESNTSRLRVSELRRFEFDSSQSTNSRPNQTVQFTHVLRNSGNVEDRYTLSVENGIADNADLQNLQLVIDTNGNGLIDPGEPLLTESILLAPDDTLTIVVSGIVPGDVVETDTIELQVHAQSQDTSLAVQTNRDDITISAVASLEIDLQSSASCAADIPAGERVDVSISAVNTSAVIESFQAISLVRESGSTQNLMRYEFWNGSSSLESVALLIPADSLSTGSRSVVTFGLTSVDLPEGQSQIEFVASIDEGADDSDDILSNTACVSYFVGASAIPGAKIRFIEPSINLQRGDSTPEFEQDEDFIDAPIYRLTNSLSENLQQRSVENFNLSSRRAVYVELIATISPELILRSNTNVRHVIVDVESTGTLDTIKLLLRESAPGSARFRSVEPVYLEEGYEANGAWCPVDTNAALDLPLDYQDNSEVCILGSEQGDVLHVSFTDPALNTDIFDTALVEPTGRVFDSVTLAGVPDAIVTVYAGSTIAVDPISDKPLEFVTDQAGLFELPRLIAGSDYNIVVTPPDTHRFPSLVSPDRFTNDNVSAISYGAAGYQSTESGLFIVAAGEAPPTLDIPIDPVNREALLEAVKTASTESVEVGDIVSYTVSVSNLSTGEMSDLSVLDVPPYGFRFVPGSTTIDGLRSEDPERVSLADSSASLASAALRFTFDDLPIGETVRIVYRLQATAAAIDSDGVNTAIASARTISGFELVATPSRADVDVRSRGVFSDDAILFGKVYVDANCDMLQDNAEWPVAGVKLYLQDGTFVITDEDGQYSLYGLRPGLHVIKVDPITLPDGLLLKPVDNRNLADADSRFVDLLPGDMHRADFAGYCPTENTAQVYEDIRARNKSHRGSWVLDEASQFDPEGRGRQLGDSQRADVDGDLSSGYLTDPELRRNRDNGEPSNEEQTSEEDDANTSLSANSATGDGEAKIPLLGLDPRSTDLPEDVVEEPPEAVDKYSIVGVDGRPRMGDPKKLAAEITAEQAKNGTFIWPLDEFSTDGRFMAVVRSGIDPVLYVNDVAIPATQIGERIVNRREKAQIVAWYGIKLKPGKNAVEIRGKDSFGNIRKLASSDFKRPAAGVRIIMRTRVDTLPADGGRSTVPIDIVINDSNGYPASGVYFVSLGTTAGEFVEPDLQASEPGTQVRIENGRGKVHVRSSDISGPMRISARAGNMETALNILQIASARPLIGTGYVSVGGKISRVRAGDDARHDVESGFEGHARAAVFLKGRVRRNMTLTLAYDSDKDRDTRLLRDVNPNDYYATMGDSSLTHMIYHEYNAR